MSKERYRGSGHETGHHRRCEAINAIGVQCHKAYPAPDAPEWVGVCYEPDDLWRMRQQRRCHLHVEPGATPWHRQAASEVPS